MICLNLYGRWRCRIEETDRTRREKRWNGGRRLKISIIIQKSATEEINPTDEGIKKKAISERISRALGLSGRDEIFKLYQNKPIGE
jgi:hypothetical protein